MSKKTLLAAASLVAALVLTACGGGTATPGEEPQPTQTDAVECALLKEDDGWFADNRNQLNEMITTLGECGASSEAEGAPLALFDWDNTVVKNDIGDAMVFWMLANGNLIQPENADWATVSPFLTEDAVAALNSACETVADPGQPMPTDKKEAADCADEILSVYGEAETTGGKVAFENFNARRMEPAYAFAAQLLAGWSPAEIQDFVAESREQNLAAEEGTTQVIGSTEVTGWVRYYDQIEDLIEVMLAHGFDVRVISASAELVAEVWGAGLGLGPEKVMGVTLAEVDGKVTPKLAACGDEDASIPYIEGKRCRVNEEVYGITGTAAFEPAPEATRQVFGAGDSDTDITFMTDATGLRLAINRNKTELMCNAYANLDGKWLVNPMFIEPKGKMEGVYPCSTTGWINPDGSMGPLLDEAGNPVPDQEDTAHLE